MKGRILVLAEHWAGEVDSITYQMLGKARELADASQREVEVLVIGHRLEGIAAALRDQGADAVSVVDDPALAQAGADLEARAVAEAVRRTDPCLLLIGYSLIGMELAPAVAAELGVPALTNCVDVELTDGAFVATRPLFDGAVHARVALEARPAVVAMQKGVVPLSELPSKGAPVRSLPLEVSTIPSRVKVLEITEEAATGVDISKADIIVAVGRGIGSKENISMVEELAEALGGVIACSRPVVDMGWLPRERQVGASGKTVAPKVYIACGISGAIQHLSGMSGARCIIAINNDPEAPIFQVAHYGVVADLFDIVPALIQEAKKARGSG